MGTQDDPLLSGMLKVAVYGKIQDIIAQGGVTDSDVARVQGHLDDIAGGSDILLYRSGKRGETAKRFTQVADALAVMAFSPGGVKLFGEHYDARPLWTKEKHRDG